MLRPLISAAFIGPFLALLLLAGCSDSSVPEQQTSETEASVETQPSAPSDAPAMKEDGERDDQPLFVGRYRCEEGSEFLLSVSDHSASVEIEGITYELRQQPAASGAFYAGDLWQVHSKGEHALLIGQDSTRDCQLLAKAKSDSAMPMERATGKE